MRKIKQLFKGLLLIVFLVSAKIALNVIGVNVVNEAHAAVSQEQVNQYLLDRGYQILSIKKGPTQRYTNSWIADTVKDGNRYITTVYCNENEIIGHGDVPF